MHRERRIWGVPLKSLRSSASAEVALNRSDLRGQCSQLWIFGRCEEPCCQYRTFFFWYIYIYIYNIYIIFAMHHRGRSSLFRDWCISKSMHTTILDVLRTRSNRYSFRPDPWRCHDQSSAVRFLFHLAPHLKQLSCGESLLDHFIDTF